MRGLKYIGPLMLVATLGGCSLTGGNAPIVGGPAATTVYTVQPGDTLYSVARRYSLDPTAVARENGITNPSQLVVGQKLNLNISSSSAAAITNVQTSSAAARQDAAQRNISNSSNTPSASAVNVAKNSTASETSRTVSPANARFSWPVSGSVIQEFGEVNKGIDIAGKEGEPVLSAADGQVLFVGNVRPYGELVIVKHDPTYVTAYGYNKQINVKQGATVKKGQQIATVGKIDTKPARVHFEIRRYGKPVDPTTLLPAR